MRIDTPAGRRGLVGLTASFVGAAALLPGAAASSSPVPLPIDERLKTLLEKPEPVFPVTAPRPEPSVSRAGRFPVRARVDFGGIAARFGNDRGSHSHAGQDVFASAGSRLVAVHDSVVVEAGGGDARGNHVALYSRKRNRTYVYFHMQGPAWVRPGQRVRAGRTVGRVGCTGRCWGDHLHFEIHRGRGTAGASIDPLPMLKRWLARADKTS